MRAREAAGRQGSPEFAVEGTRKRVIRAELARQAAGDAAAEWPRPDVGREAATGEQRIGRDGSG